MQSNKEDIPPSESKELISIINKLTLDQRANKFFDFWNFTRELQWAGIQMRNPNMTENEVDLCFKEMMLEHFNGLSSNDQ